MARLSPDNVILGLLAVEASHGYQLLETFRAGHPLARIWALGTSQLYAILKRLESQQLIRGITVHSPDAPSRTEYSVTEVGRVQFEAWLHALQPSASTRHIRTEFLSRLYLARQMGVPVVAIIAAQRAVCTVQREKLRNQRAEATGIMALALDLAESEMVMMLDWIMRCEHTLTGAPLED